MTGHVAEGHVRMRYDLVVRSRRTVLPEGTGAAAVAVSGQAIVAIAGYGEPLDAVRDVPRCSILTAVRRMVSQWDVCLTGTEGEETLYGRSETP